MANKPYDNFVLEEYIEDQLDTKLDMNNFLTVDRSLTETAGMKKKIHAYYATGNVEDLAEGEGNSQIIEAGFTEREYEVKVTQGKAKYYDEQQMRDPKVVETLAKGEVEIMANDFTAKAIAEFGKSSLYGICDFATKTTGYLFDIIVDAIAYFGESEEGLFLLINPKSKAYVRKALGEDLKYSEGYVRTGYIGSVASVPVHVSKAVPADTMYLATKEAVTAFLKKGIETERERDADHRCNWMFIRKVALVALTNAAKVVKIVKNAPATPSISVTPPTASITVGEKTQLAAVSTAVGVAIRWGSSDESKALVDALGVVTGLATGEATITASFELGGTTYSANCTVTVA